MNHEKPISQKNYQQLIDFFIRQTAKKILIPESTVELIIRDQWKNANLAARSLTEIEITGLGTYYTSSKKGATRYISLFNAYHAHKDSDDPKYANMAQTAKNHLLILQKVKNYARLEEYIRKQAPYIIGNQEFGISQSASGGDSSPEITNM